MNPHQEYLAMAQAKRDKAKAAQAEANKFKPTHIIKPGFGYTINEFSIFMRAKSCVLFQERERNGQRVYGYIVELGEHVSVNTNANCLQEV